MSPRPSSLAILAAHRVLYPEGGEGNVELVAAALRAADRIDPPITQEFQERLKIMRAVALYRGAIGLQSAYIIASAAGIGEPHGRPPMQCVLEALAILTAAESHLGAAPYPEGAHGDQLTAL